MKVDEIELKDEERQPCEVWTRVMGYYRPVSAYNIGKKGEFNERVNFRKVTKGKINGYDDKTGRVFNPSLVLL